MRYLTFLTLLVAGISFVGCVNMTAWNASVEKSEQLTAAVPEGKLVVEGNNGRISILANSEVSEVVVDSTIRAFGKDIAEAQANIETVKVVLEESNGDLRIYLDRPDDFHGAVSYEIKLPPGVASVARTTNGTIVISDTAAPVEAYSTNGSISVKGATEKIVVQTSNAGATIETSTPVATSITTSNAPVVFKGALTGTENKISTSNAQVQLSLTGEPVAVTYATSNASVSIDGHQVERSGETLVGEGNSETSLNIRTSNAGITIDYSDEALATEAPTTGELRLQ